MPYLTTPKLLFPLKNYRANGASFGKRTYHKEVYWGRHLGEDCHVPAGTDVRAIGRGRVVYAAVHEGSSEKGNWGTIIIIRHKHPRTKRIFYSLYAHLGTCFKRIGEKVQAGEPLGFIGEGMTPENGFWPSHLHFAIYTGPWDNQVLPGYYLPEQNLTQEEWWHNPSDFIRHYSV